MRKASTIEQLTPTLNFGMFLKIHREQWNITQREVLLNLPGWTQTSYSRLEGSVLAPGFEQLQSIYSALSLAGALWALSDLHQFLTLARKRIEQKKSHLERRSDTEWATLRYNLASSDALADDLNSTSTTDSAHESLHRPLPAETRHLIGREEWVSTVIHTLQGTPLTKLLVLRGPMGVGKSSELHRLARHFLQMTQPAYQVVWVSLLPVERGGDAENALDVSLATVLAESGIPPLPTAQASLKERITYALIHLQRSTQPMLILLDNAECLLTEQGILTSCWEQFLTAFLQCEHSATLVLASKEWPGWSGRNSIFVAETTVPALTLPAGVQLLQRLGLDAVPVEHLQQVSERAGGLPLCLEWICPRRTTRPARRTRPGGNCRRHYATPTTSVARAIAFAGPFCHKTPTFVAASHRKTPLIGGPYLAQRTGAL